MSRYSTRNSKKKDLLVTGSAPSGAYNTGDPPEVTTEHPLTQSEPAPRVDSPRAEGGVVGATKEPHPATDRRGPFLVPGVDAEDSAGGGTYLLTPSQLIVLAFHSMFSQTHLQAILVGHTDYNSLCTFSPRDDTIDVVGLSKTRRLEQ